MELNNNEKFRNHPKKMLMKNYAPTRWTYQKPSFTGTPIGIFLKAMFEFNKFQQIPEERLLELHWNFKPSSDYSFNVVRQIEIPNKFHFEGKKH